MNATETPSELSKHAYVALERVFKMIAAGAKINSAMGGSYLPSNDGIPLPGRYAFFQAFLKVGEPGSSEAIASIDINADGTGKVEIGVNRCPSKGRYASTFFSKNDLSKELQIIEYFLKRNFID